MTNSKSTKKALLSSALALTLCVAMLIATTFAWFTDTASTSVNTIQAGTLDVALEKATAWDEEGKPTTWADAEGETLSFLQADSEGKLTPNADILWEPGCTYRLQELRISNEGNLKLKYKIIISGINGNAELNDVITWTITNDADGTNTTDLATTEYTLDGKTTAKTDSDILTISGHMNENASNDYQGLSINGISIKVVATQDTGEYDSSSSDYDALAQYPVYTVANVKTTVKEEGGVTTTKVADQVEIKSKETTTVNGTKVSVATATIPANVVLDNGTTQVKLVVEDSKDTNSIEIAADQAKKTLEVKLEGVASGNTVPATVSFYIESGLTGLVLYHNSTAMTAVASVSAVDDNQQYYYDFATGEITMKSATFSPFTYVYDATVATTAELAAVTDDTAKTVTISSARLLAGFAQSVNNGKSYSGYTITLTTDIDLQGREWTPIMMDGKNPDTGGKIITFDGKEHTISNFKVTAGTGVKNTGLFGTANFSIIKNLNVDNATVTGINHVGAIVGHGMVTTIENCKVTNSTITTSIYNNDDGDKAGAIAGWLNGGKYGATNCTVVECSIKGYRDIGGLIGYVGNDSGATATVTGNTVKDTTVTQDATNGYEKTMPETIKEIIGRTDGEGHSIASNTANNVTVYKATK